MATDALVPGNGAKSKVRVESNGDRDTQRSNGFGCNTFWYGVYPASVPGTVSVHVLHF